MSRDITLRLEKPLYGGLTLGYHGGKAIMVPFGAPGETVRVRIIDEKNDFCTGAIEGIVERSESRIVPACPHFETCGGCGYAHISYEAELGVKKQVLLDSLSRIGGFDLDSIPDPDLVTGERFNYRSHATLKVMRGMHGFYRKGTNVLVSVNSTGCLLLAPELNDWIMGVPDIHGDYRVAVGTDERVLHSFDDDPIVEDLVMGHRFARPIGCFFQANRFLRGNMMEIVNEYAGPERGESLLDIGCGVGFLTIGCSGMATAVRGIDTNPASVRWARKNARENGKPGTEFIVMPSSRLHPARHRADVVVTDPPRAGIDRGTRRTILAMAPRRIVYASCNPATFSRDAKDLAAGGYVMDRLSLIDMFPCTHHIELVSRFTRQSPVSIP